MMGRVSEGAGEVTREWEPAQRPEKTKQVFYLSPLEKNKLVFKPLKYRLRYWTNITFTSDQHSTVLKNKFFSNLLYSVQYTFLFMLPVSAAVWSYFHYSEAALEPRRQTVRGPH